MIKNKSEVNFINANALKDPRFTQGSPKALKTPGFTQGSPKALKTAEGFKNCRRL